MSKNLNIVLVATSLILLSFSCTEDNKNERHENHASIELTAEHEEWQKDSLGCERRRTKELSEKIILNNGLEEENIVEFKKLFGQPNKSKKNKGEVVLSYYFNSMCSNGKLSQDADYCIAEFRFTDGRLTKRNYICF